MLRGNDNKRTANGHETYHPSLVIEQEIGNNIAALVPLLEAYREEVGRVPDARGTKGFLSDRVYYHDSVIFTACIKTSLVGFIQIYPFYSLMDLSKQWLLGDLYVLPDYRRRGVGRALLKEALQFASMFKASAVTVKVPWEACNTEGFFVRTGLLKDQHSVYFVHGLNA